MKTAASIFLILSLAFIAFGQVEDNKFAKKAKPSFSGKWILDRTKTKIIDYDLTLIVAHQEPELKVTSIFNSAREQKTEERTYFTDGRKSPDRKANSQNISKEVRWAGRNLLMKFESAVPVEGGLTRSSLRSEEWELSKDEKSLTIKIVDYYPFNLSGTRSNQSADGLPVAAGGNQFGAVRILKFKRAEN
jgi:predicted subunit of tRNA(5-methylaminomethyl-2-thiouridylate) methyltransferase